MLKQIENKAMKSFMENSARPGHARPGPYTPKELAECVRAGLLRPDGKGRFEADNLYGIAPMPDPMEPTVAEAPENLRRVAEAARSRLDAIHARRLAILEKGSQAEVKRKQAGAETFSSYPPSSDNLRALGRKEAEIDRLAEELKMLDLEEVPARRAVSEAENAIKYWIDDERLFRRGMAERPEVPVF